MIGVSITASETEHRSSARNVLSARMHINALDGTNLTFVWTIVPQI